MSESCDAGIPWIWLAFRVCVVTNREKIGFWIGLFSVAIWLVSFVPQLWQNYRTKGVEGISMGLLLFYLFGDLGNLEGALLARQTSLQIFVAVSQVVETLLCIVQWLYYGIPARTEFSVPAFIGNVFLNLFVASLTCWLLFGATAPPLMRSIVGFVLGYTSAAAYLLSRIPQIWHNFTRKSTTGLSIRIFQLLVVGNVTYATSVLLMTNSVVTAVPWLLGTLGTVMLDFVLFYQFWCYDNEAFPEIVELETTPSVGIDPRSPVLAHPKTPMTVIDMFSPTKTPLRLPTGTPLRTPIRRASDTGLPGGRRWNKLA